VRVAVILAFGLSIVACRAADWSLDVVPNSSNDRGAFIEGPFVVVLTNTSNRELRVWEEEAAPGYASLSFELAKPGENTPFIRIKKRPRAWAAFLPAFYIVKPRGHFAWVVDLNSQEWDWEIFPGDWRGLEKVVMQARFDNERDESTDKFKVWTGQIVSDPLTVRLACIPGKSMAH
jgi:hypothetical protein